MAFGDTRGTLAGGPIASIPATFSATGSVVVSVGDLIVSVIAQQTSLTVTDVKDNVHGAGVSYTPQNAGTDPPGGSPTGRAFYKIVATAGTLTSVDATCTASANDAAHAVVVFEGPFTAIDKNPVNLTDDLTTPMVCPTTGVMSQADELVVSWIAIQGTAETLGMTSPSAPRLQVGPGGTNGCAAIGSRVVSATTSVIPEWTFVSDAPTGNVIGTMTFTKAAVDTLMGQALL